MLNLFRLPFKSRKDASEKNEPEQNLTVGIFGNFLRQRKDLSEADFDHAYQRTAQEMQNLQKRMQQPGANQYDLMSKALRKMDRDLDKWS